MPEIQPLGPVYPVVKPDKITKHDHSSEKQPQEKPASDEQDSQPATQIDERV